MKTKFTLLVLIISAFLGANAQQQIPNSNFESWTNGDPTGWNTIDKLLGDFGETIDMISQDTAAANVVEGTSSAKLTNTVSVAAGGNILQGIMSAGPLAYTGNIAIRCMPFSGRPDTLAFVYKYVGLNVDTMGGFIYNLMNGNAVVAGPANPLSIYGLPSTNNQFFQIRQPVAYLNSNTPDSLRLAFYSDIDTSNTVGTSLWVDDLKLIYISTSTDPEKLSVTTEAFVFPSPVSHQLNVRVSETLVSSRYAIYGLDGRKYNEGTLENLQSFVNVSHLASGSYILDIMDKDAKSVAQSRFTVAR